jgi:hypothetical protein
MVLGKASQWTSWHKLATHSLPGHQLQTQAHLFLFAICSIAYAGNNPSWLLHPYKTAENDLKKRFNETAPSMRLPFILPDPSTGRYACSWVVEELWC